MKKFYLLLSFFAICLNPFAQKATVTGTVRDSKSNELLVGVAVVAEDNVGVVTDKNGAYILDLKVGTHTITYKYIGYATESHKVTLSAGEILTRNINLVASSSMLNEMVVSAGKFEQKMSDVTLSIQTIKPAMIENNNTNDVVTIIDKTPGVTILDGQPSIRGGSGYSYGAGSRVLMLVDDLPMLAGDAGDIKYDFIPVESVEQIEVIKGASSALYGSSALNGVFNIRTALPGNTPQTKIIINNGIYCNPQRKSIIWWGGSQPKFMGTQFLHSRKIGNFDCIIGGQLYSDEGYKEKDDVQRYRLNATLRYRDKKIKGLTYGCSANYMTKKGNDFLLWQNGDSGVYRPSPSYSQEFNNNRLNIDPFIVYHRDSSSRHSLKGRYFQLVTKNNTGQSSRCYVYYAEYQFQKHFRKDMTMTTGITETYNNVSSDLYGGENHDASNEAFFAQFDKKIKRLTLSAGARFELYKMDSDYDNSKPVFRTGLNYQLAKASFLRASFGQGFRYPAIAERYISSAIGVLKIFPNDLLKPETGWSTELGFKQGFKISSWYGYIDVAGFWTQYHNMIEFTFGQYYPTSLTSPSLMDFFNYTGFKAINISNAQINGVDITVMGQGKLLGLPATLLLGYTYTNPIDLDAKRDTLKTSNSNILKYRYYHSAKIDFDLAYHDISFGLNIEYHSYMINIDKAFEEPLKLPNGEPIIQNGDTVFFLPGLKQYREKHHTGDIVFDARFSYQITDKSKLSLVMKNVFNHEYMLRPGDVQAPRNIALQYSLKF